MNIFKKLDFLSMFNIFKDNDGAIHYESKYKRMIDNKIRWIDLLKRKIS